MREHLWSRKLEDGAELVDGRDCGDIHDGYRSRLIFVGGLFRYV